MTKDELIALAKEAGFQSLLPEESCDLLGGVWVEDENILKHLERFAALVAAHEREECARAIVDLYDSTDTKNILDFAAAIRGRTNAG